MTIGIGAICDGGRSAVIAADRQLSLSLSQLEIETHQSKLQVLSNRCVVAASADGLDLSVMADCVESLKIEAAGLSTKKIAERLQVGLRDVRTKKMRDLIARNGIDPDEFKSATLKSPTPTTESLRAEIAKIQVNVDYVVVGIDNDGTSHIWECNTSFLGNFDDRGFAGTGSGWMHAVLGMVRSDFTPNASLSEAIYRTYEAKKLSESATGVGAKTDMAIMEHGKPLRLVRDPHRLLRRLDQIREKLRPPSLGNNDARAIMGMLR